ncbi:hypothetical protein GPECTOR_2g975 [Gonium pectorale]|uniref:Uncharacterized protein n=1 Tax=Gonium pectorale TaxID=33097 RepID=A0A150H250_GONPE|nr:hypothetical protein GPECTOR_2g975 [Gonium pectorale]|eukprot:KXZ56093.1 hypothetical protein GPECTOR_2g975 [Gonium pectorale]
MPAKVTLFNAACKPVYDLGSGPYNIARWNPFGRFFIIAGFGNLPGDIVFYDKKTSGTCKQMGAVRSPAVAAEWSPDGRLLLAATTAPRLRVDNNLKVFTYYGEQRMHVPFATLLDAQWRPAPRGAFADRPQSPERLAAVAKGEASTEAPTKPSYVPPHLRQKQQVSKLAVEDANRKFYDAFASGRLEEMERIVGEGEHVQVVHPGASCIAGREQVMESWRAILRNVRPGAFKVRLEDVRVHAREDFGFVTCVEIIDADDSTGRIIATNVFEKQGGVWRIVQHHGSPSIARFR